MTLLDVIEAKDIEQLRQGLMGALDRLKEIISELRDESEIEIKVTFRRKAKNDGNSV
ncbi:MAG TPA: hypothetical protein PKJ41_03800 [Bryobacteraceae bacterium]|nr:hypothetical protein [Bryobacteraceae bacterium]HPT26939.1 hypothetical protein [Bryobacteraceae bacterium]